MPYKQQDVAKPNISPVLFMTVDGEPMSFFLRPGPAKRKLQPLITAGAGVMFNVQQPGAILLMDPEEGANIPEASAHRYVSTQYILDCIEKDEQLNLEDYRLNVQVVARQSARQKGISPGHLKGRGRLIYTAEEDAAILSYASKHKTEIGGNKIWQALEEQRVTNHSWQSMKTRHRLLLAKKQSEEVATKEEDAKGAEEEVKVEGLQEPEGQRRSNAEDSASSQTHSAQTDLTQIDDQLIPPESRQPEIVEAQTFILSEDEVDEVQHVDPQTDKQPAESTQVEAVEAETSVSPQPGRPCLDPQTDPHTVPAEATEPEMEEPIISEPESVSAPPAGPESQQRPSEKRKGSPEPEQLQRRVTRRQIMLEMLPLAEPYGKKLRSSATSPGKQPSSHPQATKKAKSNKSSLDHAATENEPPSKRARGRSEEAEAESPQVEAGQAAVSETTQADTESVSVPQEGGKKKKEKRKLGILELAAKEFEDESDESESDDDGAPDLQNPADTVTVQPTSTDPPPPTSDTAADAASTRSNPEQGGPCLQENLQETQASSSECPPKTGCPEPAATVAVAASSKVHFFIFDSESQEEESQSLDGDNDVAPDETQPTVNKDDAQSLTQVQLEEDMQRLKELMKQTNKDLVSVTKALLMTNGDFSAALKQLLNPSSLSRPLWNRNDDELLLSAGAVVRQQLQEKYGEEEVAKRIVFLDVEA